MTVSRREAVAAVLLLAVAAGGASAQDVQARLAPCLACHGASGTSQTPDVPSLGGQPAFYLTVQLLMFREGMRIAAPMNEMLHGAGDEDLRAMADALAELPAPKPNVPETSPARMAGARDLVQRNRCNVCHQPNFAGDENVPRIAGQREEYLLKSLRGYKDNTRRGYDSQMADVVASLTDPDFVELAYFLARQP
jgi:cytochrome c553